MHLLCWKVAGANAADPRPRKPRCPERPGLPASCRNGARGRAGLAPALPAAGGSQPAPRRSGQECRLLGGMCPGLLGEGCGGSLIYYFILV